MGYSVKKLTGELLDSASSPVNAGVTDPEGCRPHHKIGCFADSNSGVVKTFLSFQVNGQLIIFAQIAVILALDLIRKPTRGPVIVEIRCNVLPAMDEILDIMQADHDPKPDEYSPKGKLQVSRISARTAPYETLDSEDQMLWRKAREKADSKGFTSSAVALVEMGVEDGAVGFAFTMDLLPPAYEMARTKEPFVYPSDEMAPEPMNAETCIRYINWRIRGDQRNQFKLAMPLRDYDVGVIREVGQYLRGTKRNVEHNKDVAVRSLHYRMMVDPLYHAVCEQLRSLSNVPLS